MKKHVLMTPMRQVTSTYRPRYLVITPLLGNAAGDEHLDAGDRSVHHVVHCMVHRMVHGVVHRMIAWRGASRDRTSR